MNKIEELQKQFEANFQDGEPLGQKAITFTSDGAFDVAQFFYDLGREHAIEECKDIIEHMKIDEIEKTGITRFEYTGVYENVLSALNELE